MSDVFSETKSFSFSIAFSKSNSFSKSNEFIGTNTFSGSNLFSKTEIYSLTKEFSESNSFAQSNDFTNSIEFSPSEIAKIDLSSLKNKSNKKIYMTIGIISAIVIISIIALVIFMVLRNKNEAKTDQSSIEANDQIDSMPPTIIAINPLYDDDINSSRDPFLSDEFDEDE